MAQLDVRGLASFGGVSMLLLGCGGPSDDAPAELVRRDSAGIEIVEVRVPGADDATRWTVEPVPSFTPDSGDALAEFRAVFQVLRLSDGTVVALDAGAPYVRAFAPDGGLRWTAVAEGDGPGEMRNPSLLSRLSGDTLAVDDRQARGLLLTSDGTAAGELPTPGLQSRQGEAMRAPLLLMRLGDGSGIAIVVDYRISDLSGTGVFTFAGPARILGPSGATSEFAHWRFQDAPRTDAGSVTMLLGATAAFAPAPEGFVYGFPRRDQLIVYDDRGNVRRMLRGEAEPRAPADEEVAVAREAWVESGDRGNADERRRQALRLTVNDTLPLFRRVLVGSDGAIWRERFEPGAPPSRLLAFPDSGARWDVFAADGRWLALVRMPAGFALTDAGDDWVAGIHVDELDVQSPRVYALSRTDG